MLIFGVIQSIGRTAPHKYVEFPVNTYLESAPECWYVKVFTGSDGWRLREYYPKSVCRNSGVKFGIWKSGVLVGTVHKNNSVTTVSGISADVTELVVTKGKEMLTQYRINVQKRVDEVNARIALRDIEERTTIDKAVLASNDH